jgi:hypothetical protein
MKPIKIAFLFTFYLLGSTLYAQLTWPGQALIKRTLKIHTDTSVIVINIIDEQISIRPKNNRNYYWYANRKILNNKGGIGGLLLDGVYTRYNTNDQLIETGSFKKGLKQGKWKLWDEQGNLLRIQTFKKGKLLRTKFTYLPDNKLEFQKPDKSKRTEHKWKHILQAKEKTKPLNKKQVKEPARADEKMSEKK